MATPGASWQGRSYHAGAIFNNQLWIIGGWDGTTPFRDVWTSVNGTTWTQVTASAPWAARYGHSCVVFDNKLWIFGGKGPGSNNVFTDAWCSTNGSSWTQVSSGNPWAPYCHLALVHNNMIWIMGGDNGYTASNKVWVSKDGIEWIEASSSAEWSTRKEMSGAVFDGKLYLFGGCYPENNEVWSLEP